MSWLQLVVQAEESWIKHWSVIRCAGEKRGEKQSVVASKVREVEVDSLDGDIYTTLL